MMIAYHGASTARLASIQTSGLRSPYVTDDICRARYYAGCEVDEVGGESVVLELEESCLRYDAPAMHEPVMASDEDRDAAWDQAALEHPEWCRDNSISVPPGAWQVSWSGVGSARVEGIVGPDRIRVREGPRPTCSRTDGPG